MLLVSTVGTWYNILVYDGVGLGENVFVAVVKFVDQRKWWLTKHLRFIKKKDHNNDSTLHQNASTRIKEIVMKIVQDLGTIKLRTGTSSRISSVCFGFESPSYNRFPTMKSPPVSG